ncbi:MAG: hypothetical protein LBF93_00855 [Zoogloeaceae bacterium]|jgi:hypothetical protein|nr:hypothetical protein [Zoogloeaceae bacterium]
MSRAPFLLSLLLFSILPFAAWADGATCPLDAIEEQGASSEDMQRDASHSEEKRRLKHLWRRLSNEERDALRQQMRANWERMAPERRQQLRQAYQKRQENPREESYDGNARREQAQQRKARRKAHEAYWQSLTPEERETLRNALRETVHHWQRHEEETAKIMTEALPTTKALSAENAHATTAPPPEDARETPGKAERPSSEKRR